MLEPYVLPHILSFASDHGQFRKCCKLVTGESGQLSGANAFLENRVAKEFHRGQSAVTLYDDELTILFCGEEWLMREKTILGDRHGYFVDGVFPPKDLKDATLRKAFTNLKDSRVLLVQMQIPHWNPINEW